MIKLGAAGKCRIVELNIFKRGSRKAPKTCPQLGMDSWVRPASSLNCSRRSSRKQGGRSSRRSLHAHASQQRAGVA
eukprot:scaffold20465_cov33-Tisochrysis_lutea.AAC.1